MSIGKIIKQIRTKQNLTQLELSRRSGIPAGYIAKMETDVDGYCNPSTNRILKLSKALNVSLDDLVYQYGHYYEIENREKALNVSSAPHDLCPLLEHKASSSTV